MAQERAPLYTEQVSGLVEPDTRLRLDAVALSRRKRGVSWPDQSLGAVLRDAINAGIDEVERAECDSSQAS